MEENKPDQKPYMAGLIRRYLLSETLSDAEIQDLEQWIDADIINRQFFIKLGSLYAADERMAKTANQKP